MKVRVVTFICTRASIHIYVDSSRTVLEHHRSFSPFVSVLIAAKLYWSTIDHPINISKQLEKENPRQLPGIEPGSLALATGALTTELRLPHSHLS